MKFCAKCGQQLLDEDTFCSKCGAKQEANINFNTTSYASTSYNSQSSSESRNNLQLAAMIFMIISCASCVLSFIMNAITNPNNFAPGYAVLFAMSSLVPLLWILPMTIVYITKTKKKEKVSTSFKVCSLIFASLFAGILMLCDND